MGLFLFLICFLHFNLKCAFLLVSYPFSVKKSCFIVYSQVRLLCELKDGLLYDLICRCCKLCGRVLAEDNFAEEVQFVKSSDGQVCDIKINSNTEHHFIWQ